MKNCIFIILLLSLFSCNTGLNGKRFPKFNVLRTDSTLFNTGEYNNSKPIVLFFFSTTCPYCQMQTEEIVKDIKALKDIQFCMVANDPAPEIKEYAAKYHLQDYKNITIGRDTSNYFAQYYKPTGIPYMVVYSKHKKLIQIIPGKVDTKHFLKIT
jgi:thioredoxin-related protein